MEEIENLKEIVRQFEENNRMAKENDSGKNVLIRFIIFKNTIR